MLRVQRSINSLQRAEAAGAKQVSLIKEQHKNCACHHSPGDLMPSSQAPICLSCVCAMQPPSAGEVLSASTGSDTRRQGPIPEGPQCSGEWRRKPCPQTGWVQLCLHCQAWGGRQGLYASFLYVQNRHNSNSHPQVMASPPQVVPLSPGHGPTSRPLWGFYERTQLVLRECEYCWGHSNDPTFDAFCIQCLKNHLTII